jgi:hypothetical protein
MPLEHIVESFSLVFLPEFHHGSWRIPFSIFIIARILTFRAIIHTITDSIEFIESSLIDFFLISQLSESKSYGLSIEGIIIFFSQEGISMK